MTLMVMKTTTHNKNILSKQTSSSEPFSDAMRRDLGRIVGPQYVLHSAADRLAYQVDCWPRGIIRTRAGDLNHHLPAAVVQPASVAEIVELVRWARTSATPLVPF